MCHTALWRLHLHSTLLYQYTHSQRPCQRVVCTRPPTSVEELIVLSLAAGFGRYQEPHSAAHVCHLTRWWSHLHRCLDPSLPASSSQVHRFPLVLHSLRFSHALILHSRRHTHTLSSTESRVSRASFAYRVSLELGGCVCSFCQRLMYVRNDCVTLASPWRCTCKGQSARLHLRYHQS